MNTEIQEDALSGATIIDAPPAGVSQKPRFSVLRKLGSSQLVIWAALVFVFSALPLLHISEATIGDADIWWHMRAGEWIVQHHQMPRTDPLSASTMGQPWVDYSWVFEVIANWLIAHFDLAAIVWYQIVMRVVITAALFILVRRITPHFWCALALTALGMFAMIQMFGPRPGLFSLLFFIIELHLLLQAQRTGSLRSLWAIPLLFALWANIHIEFVQGLFLLGVFCLEPLLEGISGIASVDRTTTAIPNRKLWLVLGASLLATVANPYGIRLHLTALHYAHDTRVYDVIDELRAMDFRNPGHWAVLLVLMLGCFALGRSRPVRTVWVVLLGWSAWMSFRSMREVWLITIVAVVVIASTDLKDYLEPAPQKSLTLQMGLAVAATVCVLLWAGASHWNVNSQRLFRDVSENFPAGAVSYIHRNHIQGPIVNEFTWGGFLIYALPEIPVFIDGRTNVHSQDDVVRAVALYRGEAGWRNAPALRNANLVICDHKWPLGGLLRGDPRFKVAYEDRVAVLFEAVPASTRGSQQK